MIYLIGGEARSGKTILRKKLLKEYTISGIGTDSIRYMLSHTLKDSGIDHNNPPEINGPLMWPYIDSLIEDLRVYSSEDYVIEGDVLLPKYLSKYLNYSDVKVCYIGFSNISVSEKTKNILKYRKEGDWTTQYSEKELRKFVRWGINESKKYKKECKKLEVMYYDIDKDFEESVENIVENFNF